MAKKARKVLPHDGTLLLNQSEVADLLGFEESIKAVHDAFRWHGEKRGLPPGILGARGALGGFHIKSGLIATDREYFVTKINANFPGNLSAGMAAIQGLIVILEGDHGLPLVVMDSIEITKQRTAAATVLAATSLARADSATVMICGCGNQGKTTLMFLLEKFRLKTAYVFDVDPRRSEAFAREFSARLKVVPVGTESLSGSLMKSDICVTCTPSRSFYVQKDAIAPGTFVAAVGADSEEKQELDPLLFVGNKIVADVLAQSATVGDLHHALAGGYVALSDVHAELGEIVIGKKKGRTDNQEITIFDSTGMALQDAFASMIVYEKAVQKNIGTRISFASPLIT